MKTIFLTGSTGFLGSYILRDLLSDVRQNPRIFVLIRGENVDECKKRLNVTLSNHFSEAEIKKHISRLTVFCGDLSKKNMGLSVDEVSLLSSNVTDYMLCAANTDFRMDIKIARMSNVETIKNFLDFYDENSRKSKIHYISTVFVSGFYDGIFKETDYDLGQNFKNAYEQSKYEAEGLLRAYAASASSFLAIYRPSIVSGEFVSGRTLSFKMFYQPSLFFYQEIFSCIPANWSTPYNFMPVDVASKAIILLLGLSTNGSVFHVSSRQSIAFGEVISISAKFLKVKPPKLVSGDEFSDKEKSFVKRALIAPFLPYFSYSTQFDNTRFTNALGKDASIVPLIDEAYIVRTLKYCLESGYLRKFIK